jgi:hypothetical protein
MKGQRRVTSGIPERAIVVTCLALAMGCGGERNGAEAIDSVRLELDFGGGVTLTSVNYDLTGPNGFVERMGTLSVGSTDTVIGNFGSLPAGMGYHVTVQGTASDGASACTGEITFNVPHPNVLQIPLTCSGRATLSGSVSACPTVDSLEVVPSEVYVGASMQLTLAAHDPDSGPSPLTAAWSAPAGSGTLTNTSTTGATFTCTTAGSFVVSVSVDDGTPGMQCADSASVNVVCTPLPGAM